MRLQLALLLPLLNACAAKTPAAEHAAVPVAAKASSPQNTFVLAWFDASFFESPNGKSVGGAYDFGGQAREAHLGEHYPMRVLEDRGDWIRVVSPHEWLRADTTSLHCIANNLFAIDALAIEMWIHQDDLVPVLQQRFTHRVDEHSYVDLLPGTPIIAEHPWADGYHLPVTVPPQHIGLRYQPADALIPKDAEGYSYSNVSEVTLTMGTTAVSWRQPVANYATKRSMRVDDAGQHAKFMGSCGHFGLSFEGTVGEDSMSGIMGMAAGNVPKVRAFELPVGTPLFWKDGTDAGSVLKAFRRKGTPPDGPTFCMNVPMGLKLKATTYLNTATTVCVHRTDVRDIEMDFRPFRNEEHVELLK